MKSHQHHLVMMMTHLSRSCLFLQDKYSALLVTFLFCTSCVYHDLNPAEAPSIDCSSVSWQTDILPIIETSCAITECHDGITRLDWRDYNNAKQFAATIKANVMDHSMPFDSSLPQEEIEMIACWVNNGAPNN